MPDAIQDVLDLQSGGRGHAALALAGTPWLYARNRYNQRVKVIVVVGLLLTGCGQAATQVYEGPRRSKSKVALLSSLAEEELGVLAALLPGRYRVIANPRRPPSSKRYWAIDADFSPGHEYVLRVAESKYGLCAATMPGECRYHTGAHLQDISTGSVVAVGVPIQEAASLPSRSPLLRDPKGKRCPPTWTDTDCAALPSEWYDDGSRLR